MPQHLIVHRYAAGILDPLVGLDDSLARHAIPPGEASAKTSPPRDAFFGEDSERLTVEVALPQEPEYRQAGRRIGILLFYFEFPFKKSNKFASRSSLLKEVLAMGARHSNRHDLAGEHAFADTGQLILFAVFLITWITDSFLLRYSILLSLRVLFYIRFPAGMATLVCSALLAQSAHRAVFGKPDRKPGVICSGVFSIVRHPMYLGSWLFTVGLVILTTSVSSAAVSIFSLLVYDLVARGEELLLVKKYGDEYREYQVRVPMLFPFRITKRRLPRG